MLRRLFSKNKSKIDEDLSRIIEENREEEGSDLSEYEKELLSSAMKFSNIQAEEVCVPASELAFVDITDDFDTVIEKFRASKLNHLVVIKDNIDTLIGVVALIDMLDFLNNRETFSLKAIVKNCTFVPETLQLPKVVTQMKEDKHQLAVVVDEYGGTTGLITIKDILSEFVGDIDDMETTSLIKMVRQNIYLADPRIEMDELKKIISNFEYDKTEDESFETLSGLILQICKRIPQSGEQIALSKKWHVKVLDSDPRKINLVELVYAKNDKTKAD